MAGTLGSKCDALGVSGGADINSCSEFVSELVEKGKVDTLVDNSANETMTTSSTVVIS